MQPFRYRIVVEWSDADAAFIARVPAIPSCSAPGATAEAATKAVHQAAELELKKLKRSAPPHDTTADYSGQLRLRLPRSLHEGLSRLATVEGVSLNQILVTLLAEGFGRNEGRRKKRPDGDKT